MKRRQNRKITNPRTNNTGCVFLALKIGSKINGYLWLLEFSLSVLFPLQNFNECSILIFGNNSGLGLSICKQIVKTHGGSIIAGNKENGGAIFTVTFPLVNR